MITMKTTWENLILPIVHNKLLYQKQQRYLKLQQKLQTFKKLKIISFLNQTLILPVRTNLSLKTTRNLLEFK